MRLRLRQKLFLVCVGIGIVPALLLVLMTYREASKNYEIITDDALRASQRGMVIAAQQECRRLEAMARMVVGDTDVHEALLSGDAKGMESMQDRIGPYDYLVVTGADGQVIAMFLGKSVGVPRESTSVVIDPAWPSELVSPAASFQHTIDLKGRFPVLVEGDRAGEIWVGSLGFLDDFVQRIQRAFGTECSIFRGDVRVATTLTVQGVNAIGSRLGDREIESAVLENLEPHQRLVSRFGMPYKGLYNPITDQHGNAIGMYFVGIPRTTMIERERTFMLWIVLLSLVLFVAIIIVARYLARSITGTLSVIMDNLVANSSLVASSAQGIHTAARTLADGASTQASALEESSSALEQIASMTQHSAETAVRTRETTEMTVANIADGAQIVARMSAAMDDITASAGEISHIIKTIEDIAFQTNLLALNAAVEASRAGEAGRGFAVVADEVRNLAGRSAESARETTELIGAAIQRVQNGSSLNQALRARFATIEADAAKVRKLIDAISEANTEQAQGVDHVNNAVAQMEKVTQRNAGDADGFVTSSYQLTHAASMLDEMVEKLAILVNGKAPDRAVQSGEWKCDLSQRKQYRIS